MKQKLTFLGIETSCDETAASVVQEKNDGTGKILSNIVSSQVEEHKEFGGVVPELAARAHVEKIEFIVKKAIKESYLDINDLDGVAATAGPGLIVCLTVGLNIGKAIAGSLKKPFVAVNHLEGHALSPKINKKIEFPYLLLLISGGHTQFLEVNGVNNYKRLGTTIDDAVGEAFDKTAKLLGIEFPGGPKIEEYAKKGDENYFKLPLPIIDRGGCNLSFAGFIQVNFDKSIMMNSILAYGSFSESSFVRANLYESNLQGANLEKSNFTSANLTRAKFFGASLIEANFTNANLYEADFTSANILNAVFEGANLNNAIWTNGEKCGSDSIGTCKK